MTYKLPEDWKEVKLGDKFEYRSGMSKSRDYFGRGYPFLTFKDIFNNYFIPSVLEELVDSNINERESMSIKKGDVFLTRTSETFDELGMSSVALCDIENATFNGFSKRLRALDQSEFYPKYLGYFFRSNYFRNQVDSLSTMTTRASLNNSMLDTIMIIIPPFKDQKAIGDTLFALDKKIENNKKIAENLEAQAQAIFKYWFVDFEFPNEEGKPYKSSGGEMVESELGMIPKGWEVGKLGDIVDIKYGKNLPMKNLLNEGYPVFGGNGIIGYYDRYLYKRQQVLVACRGAASGKINISEPNSFITNNSLVLETNEDAKFYYIKERFLLSDLTSFVTGSAQPQITINGIKDMKIIYPDEKALAKNKYINKKFNELIISLQKENQKLEELRDTLLPKLISGELRIPLD